MSEQEVEVAEALSDLARLFTQSPPPLREFKVERKLANIPKPDPKQEPKTLPASASIIPAHVANGAVVVSSSSTPTSASGPNVNGSVKGSSPGVLSTASPISSPPLPTVALTDGTFHFPENLCTYIYLKRRGWGVGHDTLLVNENP